ncbi:MAG: NAD(P)/FAD-dependent oxidoreductase [Planctomycetes bacterium]|nr:NAD(P)/FAD-dependent oxidoreductase [Planctomycetota bacterium]
MKIVIIGSGGAGISAIQTIMENDPDKEIHITLISSERELAYSPCALPYVISDSIPYKRLARLDSNFYKKNKIQTSWGSPVCKIDLGRKSIALKNGKTFFYDKLLIATGSVPIKPAIPGIDKTGVFFVDTLKNTRRIKDYIRKEKIAKLGKKVAVIGAGFTGIETALALRQQGINVIVIEMLDRILAKVLDDDFAKIAHSKLTSLPSSNGEKEIEFKLSSAVTEIKGKTKVKSVHLHNGRNIPVDMVIVSIGVRPNIDFLKDSGITLSKGIMVNDRMQTNEPDIYAAGDAVETTDYITGESVISAIWPNAIEQGKVAGLNMISKDTRYPGSYSINVLSLEGLPIISMGKIFNGKTKPHTTHLNGSYTYRNENSIRRLFFNHNSQNEDKSNITLAGFEAIGEFRNAGHLWSLIRKRTPVKEMDHDILMDNTAPYYSDPESKKK